MGLHQLSPKHQKLSTLGSSFNFNVSSQGVKTDNIKKKWQHTQKYFSLYYKVN